MKNVKASGDVAFSAVENALELGQNTNMTVDIAGQVGFLPRLGYNNIVVI